MTYRATPGHTSLPMTPHLSDNPDVTPRELANSVCETLRRNSHQALLVGGCVRDLLLGREPADFDVATDATPERVMSLFPESMA
jgi:tRNA nucleotidyltransferase/poly(A) polymerase